MDKKSNEPKSENSLTLKVVLDTIEKQFTTLWKTSDNLDAKAINILGFNGIIVSIVFSNYLNMVLNQLLFIMGIAFLLIALLTLIYSVKSYKFRYDPNPRRLYKVYKDNEKGKCNKDLRDIIPNLLESHENNLEIIEKKAKMMNWGLYFTYAGLIFFVLSFFAKEVS
jgi:hypothetical protein